MLAGTGRFVKSYTDRDANENGYCHGFCCAAGPALGFGRCTNGFGRHTKVYVLWKIGHPVKFGRLVRIGRPVKIGHPPSTASI